MTEKKKPRVIILESRESILDQARSILDKAGWDVTCEKVSLEALDRVANSKSPFALFISDSKLPRMEGDDILKKVRSLSPLTQRMIMLPPDDPEMLINAINKATVNACITIPFKDEDFKALAGSCFKKYRHAAKKERLRRITGHQNRQLLKTAQKLKKKDGRYKQLIDEKNTLILKLKSKKRKLKKQHILQTRITLSDLISQKGIQTTPEAFENEFMALCRLLEKELTPFTREDQTQDASGTKADPILNIQAVLNEIQDSDDTEQTGESYTQDSRLVKKLVRHIFLASLQTGLAEPIQEPDTMVAEEKKEAQDPATEEPQGLSRFYSVTISDDQAKAWIDVTEGNDVPPGTHTSKEILDLLKNEQVVYGIIDDEQIDAWLKAPSRERLLAAAGEAAIPGKNGRIKYEFQTEYTNPGKINEDGTIDFRDRGDPPFVKSKALLAQKAPAVEGTPGMSVSGVPIPIDEVSDPAFEAGAGVEVSEDGLTMHAQIDGQPHLDKLGTVSVSPDLIIDGDVDYETGNINFQGNIIVKGTIKEGFKVTGISLTAEYVDNAEITLSGDLNVSDGINESRISTQGNIYAKFISQSDIMCYGDITVSKEIIDSTLLLSGKCINTSGSIIASDICAKMGIEAGEIGTHASDPSKLKVGINVHVDSLLKQADKDLESSVAKSSIIKDEIQRLEDEDQSLYEHISEKAQTQDKAELELKEMTQDLEALKKSNDLAQIPMIEDEIKEIRQRGQTAEEELNTIFKTQDQIAKDIQAFKDQLSGIEQANKALVKKKKRLNTFKKKERPVPEITVAKTIVGGTSIKSACSSLMLRDDKSRCRFQELCSKETGINVYEMAVSDL